MIFLEILSSCSRMILANIEFFMQFPIEIKDTIVNFSSFLTYVKKKNDKTVNTSKIASIKKQSPRRKTLYYSTYSPDLSICSHSTGIVKIFPNVKNKCRIPCNLYCVIFLPLQNFCTFFT